MKAIRDLRLIAHHLQGGKTLVMHSGFAEPMHLSRQLAEGADLWPGLTIHNLMPPAPCAYAQESRFTLQTLLPHAGLRDAVNGGRAQVLRESLFAYASGHGAARHRADVVFLQVSPPDASGRVSLGLSVSFMPQVLANNPVVVAQINSHVPRTGYTLPADAIDYGLFHDEALPEAAASVGGDIDQRIADHTMTLLDDHITLEIGIGAIPEAVLHKAARLEGLAVHTGLINDTIMPLVESGRLARPVTATMAMGSERFYRWLDQNDGVSLVPVTQTHDPDLIARIPRFHAVNGALQVDLAGNVNTERVGGRIISCPGGLPDFTAGACRSVGGNSIIVLRSTAGKPAKSSIVANVDCTTLDGALVDYIVTEHGIAAVRGLEPEQRANAIRAIAHPGFRDKI